MGGGVELPLYVMHSVALLPTEAGKKYRIFRMLKTPSQNKLLEVQDWLGQV